MNGAPWPFFIFCYICLNSSSVICRLQFFFYFQLFLIIKQNLQERSQKIFTYIRYYFCGRSETKKPLEIVGSLDIWMGDFSSCDETNFSKWWRFYNSWEGGSLRGLVGKFGMNLFSFGGVNPIQEGRGRKKVLSPC